jgi:hypothetical protein
MKIFKKVLIVALCLILLPFVVALFIPNNYTVSVSQEINRSRADVVDYVRMLKHQKEYSEWVKADPKMEPEIVGTDGTVGAIQRWNSDNENVGEGEQEITSLSQDKIEVDLRFKRPWAGNAKAANLFKEIGENKTLVTNEFYGNAGYPMNLMAYLFGRKYLAEMQTKNLNNIKTILEKQLATN